MRAQSGELDCYKESVPRQFRKPLAVVSTMKPGKVDYWGESGWGASFITPQITGLFFKSAWICFVIFLLEIIMTLNDIEVLLHCHTRPIVHPRIDEPAVKEALISLSVNGLIEQRGNDYYETTDKGMAHVEQICGLPWPTQAWIGENGNIIEI